MKLKVQLCIVFLLTVFFATAAAKLSNATPPSASISYNYPICANSTLEHVTLTGTGAYTGGVFSALPVGLLIDSVTGDIIPTGSAPGTYTITYFVSSTGADPAFTATATVTVFPIIYADFQWNNATFCPNSDVPILQNTSPNGVTGIWNPSVIDNQTLGTSVYTFTPDAGQCASIELLTININNNIQPQFTFDSHNFCIGETPPLPTTSVNGITGTWNPATITTTGVYTFTPDAGQCATTVVETFSVSPTPFATMLMNSTVCEGFTSVVTFAATPNAVIEYAIDGIANQSVVVNASGAATLSLPSLPVGNHLICLVSVTTGCTNTLNSCIPFTVLPTIDIAPIPSVSVCAQYTLPAIPQGNYYTETNGTGTLLHAGDLITDTQAIYVYAENACGSDEEYFVVNVFHPVVIAPIPDVTACSYYNLPVNNDGRYFTEPHGGGTEISPGNIYNSQTIYLYATTATSPSCVSEDAFNVTIIPAANPEIISDNGTHYIYIDGTTIVQPLVLDSQLSGNYTFEWFNYYDIIAGATSATYLVDTYNPDQAWSIFVRATDLDTGCVTTSPFFWVYQSPVPAPVGDPNQTFAPGQTLADIVVSGTNIQWYDGLGRNVNANPLPLSTPLVNGATYYASQTINGYESPGRFGVTVQVALASSTFDFQDLKYGPNPVKGILNFQSKEAIQTITVYTVLGQEVQHQKVNALEFQLDLFTIESGSYFLKLESDAKKQMIRIIKE